MTGDYLWLTCSRCGAEVRSALPLCTGCGALLSTPLDATTLRPEGFGAEPEPAPASGAFEARAPAPAPVRVPAPFAPALARSPLAPTPLEPPVVLFAAEAPRAAAPAAYVAAPVQPSWVPRPLAVGRGGSAARPEPAARKVSALAIAGFILAFACFPLGLVVSLLAFVRVKASKGKLRGEWLAVLGVVIAVIMIVLWSVGSQKKPVKPRRAAATLTLPLA